jgi:transcriptional regulator with XRE-family HTH domain
LGYFGHDWEVRAGNGLMNERERQIAGRVRQVRYSNGLSQPRFAYALEISLHRLAGIEYGRTPLRVWIADMISVKFDVSLVWLAEGRGRMNPCDGLIFAICPEIKPGELLSRAWTSELKRAFRVNSLFREFCLQATLTGVAGLATGKNLERYILGFHHAIDESFQDLPHEGREKLLNVMVRALAGFAADWKLGAEDPGQSEHANSKKGLLTDSSQLCNESCRYEIRDAQDHAAESLGRCAPFGQRARDEGPACCRLGSSAPSD